ncbi:hypothetical protein ACOMHN_051438 [Nucella lapillus]
MDDATYDVSEGDVDRVTGGGVGHISLSSFQEGGDEHVVFAAAVPVDLPARQAEDRAALTPAPQDAEDSLQGAAAHFGDVAVGQVLGKAHQEIF